VLETSVKAKCRRIIEDRGGKLLNWTSPGTIGVPDDIMLIPLAPVVFIEFKRPKGGRFSAMQDWWITWLFRAGFCIWRTNTVDLFEEQLENLFVDYPKARKKSDAYARGLETRTS